MIVELENLLAFLTQIVFLFVAGSTLVNWLVFRNLARFDIALIFLPLALAILAQNLLRLFPGWETLLAPVFFLALLSHPHLLLRVAQYFRPVPVVVRRASLVSLLLIVASLPLAETAPLAVFTPAIGYFMVVETYAGVLFVRGAMKLGGVARRRLRLASLGAGLLALVFTLSLGMVLYSAGNEPSLTTRTIVNSSIQVIAMLSGLCYYFGFSPPRWLRRSWQLRELHRFLQQASKRKEYSRRAVFEELANGAARTVGAAAVVVAIWDAERERLNIELPGDPPPQVEDIETELQVNGWDWREGEARIERLPGRIGMSMNRWAERLGARTLILIPVKGSIQPWGALIAALRHTPLFAQDDLDLLSLLAEQSANSLDLAALLSELREANLSLEREVAERKQAEETFRGLLESAPDAIVVVDTRGVVQLVNSQTEKMFGYDRAEIVGQPVEVLAPRRFRKSHARHREGYMVEHPARPMGIGLDLFGLRKNGSEFPVEISLSPMKTEEGLLISAAIRDVTQRKLIEADVQKLNEDLHQRAAQLEAANRELESFSYSVSHDLRAPLRGIDGFSMALLEDYGDQLPPEAQDYLNRVRSAAQRMAELIDDLLNLSRLTRAKLQPRFINLSQMVGEITDALRERQPQRQVEFAIMPNLMAEADPNLMRIALENLLNNAWKFTSKRERAVIEFGQKSRARERTFFVRDNGAGFDMAYADKLFGVFQRLHSENDFPGTGVGLATVQRIIKIHGGRVWAEAAEDEGATFYFTLNGEQNE